MVVFLILMLPIPSFPCFKEEKATPSWLGGFLHQRFALPRESPLSLRHLIPLNRLNMWFTKRNKISWSLNLLPKPFHITKDPPSCEKHSPPKEKPLRFCRFCTILNLESLCWHHFSTMKSFSFYSQRRGKKGNNKTIPRISTVRNLESSSKCILQCI